MIDRAANSPHQNTGDLLGALRRRKSLMFFGCALGLGLGLFYHTVATRVYRAEAEIMVMSRDSDLNQSDTNEKSVVDEDVLSTHMQLFSSKIVVQDAIEQGNLQTHISSIKQAHADGLNVVKFVREKLSVSKGGDGRARDANILQVTYEDDSAKDAADVLTALVASYKNALASMFEDNSTEALQLISNAQEKLAADLKAHEDDYSNFRRSAPLLWKGNEATNLHHDRVETVERQLADVRSRILEIRARQKVIEKFLNSTAADRITDLDRLALLNESETERLKLMFYITSGSANSEEFVSAQSVRSAQVRTEYERLLSLRLREQSLRRDYDVDHPLVQTVRQQIKLVEMFVKRNSPDGSVDDSVMERMTPREILTTFVGVLNNDLEEHTQREAQLIELSAAEFAASQDLAAYEVKDRSMQAETARLNSLYDAVVERLREVNLIRDYGGFMTKVISPPEPPPGSAWPRLPISAGLGLMLGICLGSVLAMLAESTDTTFRSPDDLCSELDLPILAHTRVAKSLKSRRLSSASLVTFNNPNSMEAEAYRGLRASVFLSSMSENLRALVVTSPVQGDGKTTTSTNLAVACAQSGRKTLIIDCDMRRPRVATVFDASNDAGLSTVLSGESKLMDSIQSTEIQNLDLLTSGPIPKNPAELLGSEDFELLLDVLRKKYDKIILDTPPLLPVSDPRLVAARADGVIMAIRVQKNGRDLGIRAKELLESAGAKTLGLVVTASKSGSSYGEYGYRDYRMNKYGYEYKY